MVEIEKFVNTTNRPAIDIFADRIPLLSLYLSMYK